jgi:DNA-cytosine methyltransferase
MKVLSLFDGISGCRQALKELNIDCEYYASEIDKYAIQVAKANHSDIKHIGNVKSLTKGDKMFFYLNSFDLLIGGSPCQDLSIAKKDRKGLDGDRSSLFYEYLRILNEVKPKYFILENVASMSKESKNIITKELFNIEPIMINSALLTAQNRKRLYWVGKLINEEYKQVKIEQPEDQEIYLKDIIEEGVVDRIKSYCLDANYHKGGNLKSYFEKGRRQLVFQKPFRIGHFNKGGQGDRIYSIDGKSVCLSANGGGRGAKTGLYAIAQRGRNIVNGKRKDVKKAKTKQRFETSYSEKSNTLTTVQKDSMLLDGCEIRKLTPIECCRLQGFPDGYCDSVSKTQGYKGLGNILHT